MVDALDAERLRDASMLAGGPAVRPRTTGAVGLETSTFACITSVAKCPMSLTVAKQAAQRTTLDAVRFAEVDKNGDGRLDFDEFLALQPPALRKEQSDEEIRTWFDAVDTDGSGTITLTEWFFWALGKEAARTANSKQDSIRAVFAKHDTDSTGFLDVAEFQMACYDLGFMVPAREIFRVLDEDNSGMVQYSEILAQIKSFAERQGRAMRAWVEYEARRASQRNELDTTEWVLGLEAENAEALTEELQAKVREARASVVDLMALFNTRGMGEARGETFDQRTFDGDEGFEISAAEFTHAMRTRFGYRGKQSLLTEAFRTLDIDGSGTIGFAELFLFVMGRANHVTGGVGSGLGGQHSREEVLERLSSAWEARVASEAAEDSANAEEGEGGVAEEAEEAEAEADEAMVGKVVRFETDVQGALLPTAPLSDVDGGGDPLAAVDATERLRRAQASIQSDEAEAAKRREREQEKRREREKLRLLLLDLLQSQGLADLDLLRACDRDMGGVEGIQKKEWLRCLKRIFVPSKKQLEASVDAAVEAQLRDIGLAPAADEATEAAETAEAEQDTAGEEELIDAKQAAAAGLEKARRSLAAKQAAEAARKVAAAAAAERLEVATDRWDDIRPTALWGFEYCTPACPFSPRYLPPRQPRLRPRLRPVLSPALSAAPQARSAMGGIAADCMSPGQRLCSWFTLRVCSTHHMRVLSSAAWASPPQARAGKTR